MAGDIILKIIQFYYCNEFLYTVSEQEYCNGNKKMEAIKCFG